MSTLRVVAPGKLMLAGEYAVLAPGGVAWALAIPSGVALEATPAPRWALERGDLGVTWSEGDRAVPASLRFAHAALHVALAHLDAPPRRLTMWPTGADSSAAHKPGTGGSASACAAICAALHLLDGGEVDARRDAIFADALRAHREAQAGRGSGYDVAAVVYGELTRFRAAGQADAPRVLRRAWPRHLHALAADSGAAADTRQMLARLAAQRVRRGAELEQALAALGEPVRALTALFAGGHASELFAALRRCHEALVRFDACFELGIVTPAIAQLIRLAAGVGVTAKISGAGGGDSVVAVSDDPERLRRLDGVWRGAGWRTYPALSARGVDRAPAA